MDVGYRGKYHQDMFSWVVKFKFSPLEDKQPQIIDRAAILLEEERIEEIHEYKNGKLVLGAT